MVDEKEFDKKLQKIRVNFLQKLKKWLPEFEDFHNKIKQGDIDHEQLEIVTTQSHQLSGSAKMFGFPDMTKKAKELELCLNKLIEGESIDSINDELIHCFDDFLGEYHRIELSSDNSVISETNAHDNEVIEKYKYYIFMVDDDESIADLVINVLQEKKCKVTHKKNGKEFFSLLEKIQSDVASIMPDLIMLDINMPEMDGIEVLKQLKKYDHTKNIPIVMLTGVDDDDKVIKSISLGALDYITKPFDGLELSNKILGILKKHKNTILIADDDDLVCDLLSQRFRTMGYNIITTDNGKQALEYIKNDKPDLAILDIMMPAMDGLSVLKQMKEEAALAYIPVILLTAKGQQDNIVEGLTCGANDYITKPFDISEVSARVLGILQRHEK